MKVFSLFILTFLCLHTISIKSSGQSSKPVAHNSCELSGLWTSNHQKFELKQQGRQVTGIRFQNDEQAGVMKGTVTGNVLEGSYTWDPPNPVGPTGWFKFDITSCNSLNGVWGGPGQTNLHGGTWVATRISTPPSNREDNILGSEGDIDCADLQLLISEIQTTIHKESKEYLELFSEVEKFDQNTRMNLCTKTVDHYTDIAIVEFDNSWSNYLDNLDSQIGLAGKIPALSALSETISKGLSSLSTGIDQLEKGQLPVEEAFEDYLDLKRTRNETVSNLVNIVRLYYCNNILEHDRRLYELYNNVIPNSTSCSDFDKSLLLDLITRNRPPGLPSAIWNQAVFAEQSGECR